jgi:tetratricopeptide (TPR) repeat protein
LGRSAEPQVWIDAEGVTHIGDDASAVPEDARLGEGRQALRGLWDGVVELPGLSPTRPPDATSSDEDRTRRIVRGAVEDLERGESARAAAALESVLRLAPGHAQAHWYLALLDRQRGRYESSQAHLRAFMASAGDDLEPWRASARRRLAALADERRLAEHATASGAAAWVGVSHPHFRIYYRSELAEASPDYAATVLRYLDEARASAAARLGAVPDEPMGVLFYGRAAYLRAHRHRFSFQTVGFFDGRIHVVSAAHPAGELRALLFHEYSHAVYHEQTGTDRPYWLNEGLAELSERASSARHGLTRSERVVLRRRIDAGSWIPLASLAPSFSGLSDADARAAYIESTAAAAWIERRTDRSQRARLLALIGKGVGADEALREVMGVDTAGVDAGLREFIRAQFPPSGNAAPAGG